MAEEDLIFGKNRHFYGGLEPSNMLLFQANQAIVNGDPVIKLQCTLPNDTVYEGQTLCTVAGAVIKRKALDYPADEFDGQLVADVKESGDIFDTNVQNGDTYYYAAFPYTTQGVYNRNPVNRTVGSLSDFYAPGDMKVFTLSSSTNADGPRVRIVASLPDATTVDGVAVNEIGGAMIRKSIATYPVSETDGQLVANITEDSDFYDTNVELHQTWYYAAFPYTVEGLYNRNPVNRASITVEGVPPGNMSQFLAVSKVQDNQAVVKLSVYLPPSVENLYLVAGATIIRNASHYPQTLTDGTNIGNFTENGEYYDPDVVDGQTYYYTAFPYTTDGAYNRNGDPNNQSKATVRSTWVFGYIYTENEDPDNSIIYDVSELITQGVADTDAVAAYRQALESIIGVSEFTNKDFSPLYLTGDGSSATGENFVPGEWFFDPGDYFMPRPCMLKVDGTVDYYLNPNDYSKKADGTNSDIANPNYDGNAMMEWPKLYMIGGWYIEGLGTVYAVANYRVTDDWDCWCHYDRLGNEIDYMYMSIYYASSHAVNGTNIIKSLSDTNTYTMSSLNYDVVNDLGSTTSPDFRPESVFDWNLLQILTTMIGKSANVKSKLGKGHTSMTTGATDLIHNGQGDTLGMFAGDPSNTTDYGLKTFGMENCWRGHDCCVSRLKMTYSSSGEHYVMLDYPGPNGGQDIQTGKYDRFFVSSSFQQYNAVTARSMSTTRHFGFLPYVYKGNLLVLTGSTTTYLCDGWIARFSLNQQGTITICGHAAHEEAAGPYFIAVNGTARPTARMVYRPTKSTS